MKINLRDFYPYYEQDVFVEVSEIVLLQLKEWDRIEDRRKRTLRRHNAFYTIDYDDCEILFVSHTVEEIYERKLSREQLYAAMTKLPEAQARRIYALYFVNMSISEIAQAEKVGKSAITRSIQRGMKALTEEIKKNL